MQRFLFVVLCFASSYSFSQKKIEYKAPNDIYQAAVDQYRNREYSESLTTLNQLHTNDSIFETAVRLKAICMYAMEKYDSLVTFADQHSAKCPTSRYELALYKGLAYMELGKFAKSTVLFEEMTKKYPTSYLAFYNLGASLQNNGDEEKAIENYKKSILFNPYYAPPHLQLAIHCYEKGRYSQAFMSYATFLMLAPNGSKSLNTLILMNQTLQKMPGKKEGAYPTEDGEDFSEVDLVLKNYIAINPDYKITNEIDIAFVKQMHMLFTIAPQYKSEKGFWSKIYVPFYKELMASGHFNAFIYYIFQSTTNDNYLDVIKKKKSETKQFVEWATPKWVEICSRNSQTDKGRYFYGENGVVVSQGKLNDLDQRIGHWTFFNKQGAINSTGEIQNNKYEGEWKWFYPSGKIHKIASFKNDMPTDSVYLFYENGLMEEQYFYKNGKVHGNSIVYRENGSLFKTANFENDQYNGKVTFYHRLGKDFPKSAANYKDGKIEGEAIQYHSNKAVKLKLQHKGGEPIGKEQDFFDNGKLYLEYNFKEGQLNGKFSEFYNTGEKYIDGQFLKGDRFGKWTEYYKNGNVQSETEYDEGGKIINVFKEFRPNGKLKSEMHYRRGDIVKYKHYDAQGKVLHEGEKKQGKFDYVGFSILDQKDVEGSYLFKGGKSGLWKYYSDYGYLRSTQMYDEGSLEGEVLHFYPDGKTVQEKTTYKNNQIIGTNYGYYFDGKTQYIVNYIDNKPEGKAYFYYPNGKLQKEMYYFHGEEHGEEFFYNVDGTLDYKTVYKKDKLTELYFYGENQVIIDSVKFHGGKQTVELHYPNGKLKTRRNYLNGYSHGKLERYFMNGELEIEGQYYDNQTHGKWLWVYADGRKRQGTYTYGKEQGEWKTFLKSGQLKEIERYNEGKRDGINITYTDQGDSLTLISYKNGKKHGKSIFYSDQGEIQLIRFYEYGNLIGYSYLGKDGKELPLIPLPKGTGKIESFYQTGEKARTLAFVNGQLHGEYIKYHKNGKVAERDNFLYGMRHGTETEYNEKGQLMLKYENKFDDKDGVYESYHKNGKPKEKGTYVAGYKHGIFDYYSETGKLEKKERYISGTLYEQTIF